MIKNAIFDWSGTLQEDMRPVYAATIRTVQRLGANKLDFEEWRREFELPYMEFYRKIGCTASKKSVDAFFREEFEKEPKVGVFKEALPALEKLRAGGVRMAILSAHQQDWVENEVERGGMKKFFTEIRASVHDKRLQIRQMIAQHACRPEETAYVGDMVHDVETARAAGVKAIAVSWGYTPREFLVAAKPDCLVDEWKGLEKAFLE